MRLNADPPNIVFVLAFDRWRVEEAFAGVEGDGRAYVEKIIQVVHDVPAIREVDLNRALIETNRIIGQAPMGPFDEHEFWNVFHTVIKPLFRNVRDIRRYADDLADPDSLARECDLVHLLMGAREIDRARGETLSTRLAEKDPLFLAVLRGSLKESHSFTQGEVVSRVEHELMWDAMCDLFGEDVVKCRVEELAKARDEGGVSSDERTSLALDTARRYVAG